MMAAAPHPWDDAAVGWNDHAPMLTQWLREATGAMLDAAHIGSGAHVLDIAAGSGDQTLDIAHRVGPTGQVLATDISARILGLALAKLRDAGFGPDTLQTRVADAQALGLDGAGFDAAVCRLGLMFCHTPLTALKGIRAALKPGGRFAALVFSSPQHNPCIAIMAFTAMRHAGRPPASAPAPGSLLSLGRPGLLASLLTDAGFTDINVRAMAAPMRLPSTQHYVDFVRTAGLPIKAILASLSEAAQQEAWSDIYHQLDQFMTPEGWQGPNELLLCCATRPVAQTR